MQQQPAEIDVGTPIGAYKFLAQLAGKAELNHQLSMFRAQAMQTIENIIAPTSQPGAPAPEPASGDELREKMREFEEGGEEA